jgi:hypothetical protein
MENTVNPGSAAWSLYDFIRSRQYIRRNRQAYLLGRLQIDHELKLHRLLHGKVGRFRAFENFINVSCGATV